MGAFQEGFRMGQSAYDDAQRLRLQQADDARRQQAFEQQQKLTDLQIAAAKRADAREQQVADMTSAMAQKTTGDYLDPEAAAAATGLRPPSAALLMSDSGGYGGGIRGLKTAVSDYDREGQRMAEATGAPASAIPAPRAPNVDPTQTYKYTRRNMLTDQMQLAALRGDSQGMSLASQGLREEDIRDATAQALAEFEQHKKDGTLSNFATELNNDPAVRIFASKPDKTGRVMFLDEHTGAVVPFSEQDLRTLYVAHKLEALDPAAAMAARNNLQGAQRELALKLNKQIIDSTKTNNEAGYQNRMAGAAETTAAAHMMSARAAAARSQADLPTPLKPEVQTQLQGVLDKLDTTTDPKQRAALVTQFNGALLKEQVMGRGRHLSLMPYEKGVKPDLPEPELQKMAGEMVGQPVPDAQGNPTKVKYTRATARQAILDSMNGVPGISVPDGVTPQAAAAAAQSGAKPPAAIPPAPVTFRRENQSDQEMPLERMLRSAFDPNRQPKPLVDRPLVDQWFGNPDQPNDEGSVPRYIRGLVTPSKGGSR
jgi:hypothetical protein